MNLPVLYPILDSALVESKGCSPLAAADALLSAGARILQWRCKDSVTRSRFDELDSISLLCRKHAARFVVNDRADLARMLGAVLHVGQDDLPTSIARELIGLQGTIGLSTHNTRQVVEADSLPIDYVAFGPIFPTRTKADPDPVVGLDRLRQIRRLTSKPLVAIGGINRGNVRDVLDAGADSVAVISDLLPELCSRENIRRRLAEWHDILGSPGVQ
jgi:thiamine-phosphate pyrophosphorylase